MSEIKRKFAQVSFVKYEIGYFIFGTDIALHNFEKDIEYPEYNVKHGHFIINLGLWFINITFMDTSND